MNMKFPPASPMEIRILSELLQCKQGTSPTDLARRADKSRPSVYVLLRRLYRREYVTSKPDPTALAPGAVVYRITAKGRKARETFAKNVGLRP